MPVCALLSVVQDDGRRGVCKKRNAIRMEGISLLAGRDGSTDSSKICGNTPPTASAPCQLGNCFGYRQNRLCRDTAAGLLPGIVGWSNHASIAESVLQKEMPSGWKAFLFGAGYGNRTRLRGLGSRCTTDVRTLRINLSTAPRAAVREYSASKAGSVSLRIFFWLCQKLRCRASPPSIDGKMLVIEPAPGPRKPLYYRCTNPAFQFSGIIASFPRKSNRFLPRTKNPPPYLQIGKILLC